MRSDKRNTLSAFVETVTERIGDHVISSAVRPATPEDIRAARELHGKGRCPHSVVTDEDGWPYAVRRCLICGKGLGTV
jgi:hypothetical protein